MKEELDRHQDRLSAAERRKVWDRIRPDAARARRETTVRRWSLSFTVAAAAVAIAAILITERREEKVRREGEKSVQVVPLRPGAIPPGPATDGQIAVSPLASNDRFIYRQPQTARPFTDARSESTSTFAFDLVDGGYEIPKMYVAKGAWPPRDVVRVEDFVNAFDQGFPEVEGADFRIFLDGAPSSFGDDCRLVRIGLKARGGEVDARVVVARNAKVRVAFDPHAVVEYRLLGFDTRIPAADGWQDGRTIFAGHEVTALYEVRLAKRHDLGRILDVRVDYATPGGEQATAITAQLGATDLHPVFATAPARLRLDAAVAEFAEILKGYPWTAGHRIGDVLPTIRQLASELRADPQVAEFASFAERTAALEAAGGRPSAGAQ